MAYGPSAGLTALAQQGIILPLRALPAMAPDKSLVQMTEQYARINLDATQPAPVYASLEDAVAGKSSRFIAPGRLRYVDYYSVQNTDQGRFVRLTTGEWMKAAPAAYSGFQGMAFTSTPHNPFGWILDTTQSRQAPGFDAPLTGKTYVQYNVVQVYTIQTVNKTDWAMLGLDEWVERRLVRVVTPNPLAPKNVSGNRWIELNLQEQTMMVYDQNRLVFATLIASGVKPFYTRPGLFQIYKKKPLETMSGAFELDRSDYYYLENVPWTMYFDKERAIHGAYWRTLFGYPQSHGCVNLSPGDSNWVYAWANEGDWVYVWDPSGETPTDPSLYGSGGA
jgi:lipoprotein-anchoring transpeptidase ErfK/SrfK